MELLLNYFYFLKDIAKFTNSVALYYSSKMYNKILKSTYSFLNINKNALHDPFIGGIHVK